MGERAVRLGLAALACMALVACGGDDEERLTATELTAKGNAVCTKLDSDVKALADTLPVSISFTPEQMQDFYSKIVPLLEKAVASFEELDPPEDLADTYQSALDQIEIDRRTLEGATESPEAAKNLFDTQVDPFTATNQKLAAAGITACREGSSSGTEGGGATESPSTSPPESTTTTTAR